MARRIVLIFIHLIMCIGINAQETADVVAQRARFFSAGERLRISAKLSVELGPEKKIRELEMFSLSSSGEDKLLARVVSPAFLREMKVLLISSGGQWDTWIKTSQGVKRLGTGTRGEALFQSDFLTSDFIIPHNGWTFSAEDNLNGLRVLSRNGERGDDFAMQKLFLRSIDSVVTKRLFFDGKGMLLREYSVVSWEAMSGVGDRPSRIELLKSASKGRSTLEILGVFTEERLPDGLFQPGSL